MADSLAYLSLEGLLSAVGAGRDAYCASCYTGHYPVEFPRDAEQYLQLALKLEPAREAERAAEAPKPVARTL